MSAENGKLFWTPARTALLLELAKTHTLPQLAAKYGVTANAIHGKLWRARKAAPHANHYSTRGWHQRSERLAMADGRFSLGAEVCQKAGAKIVKGIILNIVGEQVEVRWHSGFSSWEKQHQLALTVDKRKASK